MSKTYRTGGYKRGRCIKVADGNPVAYFWRHERPRVRRDLNRSHKRKEQQYFKRFYETLPYFKTRGWISW